MPEHDRYQAAHPHCMRHRPDILKSDECRCFHCLARFKPADIKDWVDADPEEVGQTALCPRCGIDSVIGSASGVPMDDEFFGQMKRVFFS